MTIHPVHWLQRFLFCSLITLLLIISSAMGMPGAIAQLPSLPGLTGTQPLPVGVERRGTVESAGVRLDGRELFRIASPVVLNRNEPGNQIPVEVRAHQIEANLAQLTSGNLSSEETLDPKTLRVFIETINGQPVLLVKDASLAEATVLLTVTDADAQYNSTSSSTLANRWQEILERELRQALEMRQPEAVHEQIVAVIKALVATVLGALSLGATWIALGRRQKFLEKRWVAERSAIPADELEMVEAMATPITVAPRTVEPLELDPGRSQRQGFGQHLGLQRRIQTVRFLRWVLFWAIVFIWVAGIAYSLNTFPQTRHIVRTVIVIPFVLLITWFLTGLVNRLTDFATDRFLQSREQEQSLTAANLQRIATIARVIKGLKMVLLYTISILWVLQSLKLAPGAILTVGALLALAISFAAQNLVKDLVNGFLILLEDQFRIGDMIRIGTVAGLGEVVGLVENLNLRITQLRSTEGNLISIPNSTIAQVVNMSRTWARADFFIEVAYNTDVDRALSIVRATIDRMAQDPVWQPYILETQEVFGVEQLSHKGIEIRAWIKTAPLKQWDVARELRRLLKNEFDRHQIQIGTPQQLWMQNEYPKSIAPKPSQAHSANSD